MITIKKYGNRRLYDTERSRYINLDELADIVRGGEDVQVVDARTAEDLTREVLLQVVMESLHGGDLFPVAMLHRIIRASGSAPWQQMIHQQLVTGLAMVATQMDQAERMFRVVPGWGVSAPKPGARAPAHVPEPPPEPPMAEPAADASEADLEELKARLAALEKRLKR